jgi:hypothetical protein
LGGVFLEFFTRPRGAEASPVAVRIVDVDPSMHTIRSRAVRLKAMASEVLHDIDAGRLHGAATRAWDVEDAAHGLISLLMEQDERRRNGGPAGRPRRA